MSCPGHTNNALKSPKIYSLFPSPKEHTQTHNLWMREENKKQNSLTMKETYILHSAHMLLIFTANCEAREIMYYLHYEIKVIQ